MQQLLVVWNALDGRKKLIAVASAVAMFLAVLFMANAVSKPMMAILYTGLEPSAAGEVIAALEQRGVTHSVQGDTIYVDAAKRDLTRMSLAEDGLPATSGVGYELLDTLSGFGTTSQMFDAAYWRAKEGELARTILAWPQVKSVRVHIANTDARPFARTPPPVASVTLNLQGQRLSDRQARALRFLVASAVSGLAPRDVSIIDSDLGLISTDEADAPGSGNQAAELKSNVERLLAARVGAGNAVVEVTVATARDRETIVERRFDPDSRVAISTDIQEQSGNSTDGGADGVTVASNLPDGDAATSGNGSASTTSETRERINYEVSETTRELIRQPGNISRLTVAVLVNGVTSIGPDGLAVWTPRPDDELTALRELVQSAVGFDETRGDQVTIKSFEFQIPPETGSFVTASPFAGLFANSTTILQSLLLALVALGLGMFVVRPILTSQNLPALPGAADQDGLIALDGPGQGSGLNQLMADGTVNETASAAPDPVAQLRQIISERQEESVEVLRNWIENSEEPA